MLTGGVIGCNLDGMKKLMLMMLVISQLMGCQPVMAHQSEKEFDADMERIEDGIRRWHPEVIWVDVQDVYTITL